ncbi:MAG TPA: DNA replication/repair protein RecF [bacterium]|nr:DNA replication/repair protein RecF [bacterium]
MHLTHLRLINFRNHARTEIEPGPRLNCFVGQNAQGKSSILEAVEIAATGRSHRAVRDTDLLHFGEAWARVRAAVRRGDRDVEVDIVWRTETSTAGAKEFRVNGVPVRRGDLFGHVLIVASTPHDQEVVLGAPAHRRRLLDLLLSQISPAYFFLLLRYARALEQRNRLLRDLAGPAREREAALDPWDEQLSTMGAAITARRLVIVTRLSQAAREAYAFLASDQEAVSIAYAPSLSASDETAMITMARGAFARRRREEVIRGTTLTGPHRDDLRMEIDGRDLRTFGSRGQHQAAMLSLRLAERRILLEESGEEPVLLLDDAAQLLDEERQVRLMQLVGRAQALLTLTTTAALRHVPPDTTVFKVAGGRVEPQLAYPT